MRYLFTLFTFFSFTSCNNLNTEISCCQLAEKVDLFHGIHINLCLFKNEIEKANQCSALTGKPILTIYGCHGCMGDPKMMSDLITDKEIYNIIRESYILSYLYVDDKQLLNNEKDIQLNYYKKPINTIGDYNLNRQIVKYNQNAQPWYAITNSKDEDLAEPLGYQRFGKKKFLNFLKQGLKE